MVRVCVWWETKLRSLRGNPTPFSSRSLMVINNTWWPIPDEKLPFPLKDTGKKVNQLFFEKLDEQGVWLLLFVAGPFIMREGGGGGGRYIRPLKSRRDLLKNAKLLKVFLFFLFLTFLRETRVGSPVRPSLGKKGRKKGKSDTQTLAAISHMLCRQKKREKKEKKNNGRLEETATAKIGGGERGEGEEEEGQRTDLYFFIFSFVRFYGKPQTDYWTAVRLRTILRHDHLSFRKRKYSEIWGKRSEGLRAFRVMFLVRIRGGTCHGIWFSRFFLQRALLVYERTGKRTLASTIFFRSSGVMRTLAGPAANGGCTRLATTGWAQRTKKHKFSKFTENGDTSVAIYLRSASDVVDDSFFLLKGRKKILLHSFDGGDLTKLLSPFKKLLFFGPSSYETEEWGGEAIAKKHNSIHGINFSRALKWGKVN